MSIGEEDNAIRLLELIRNIESSGGRLKIPIDPRDKDEGFWSVSLFFDQRKKPDDKPQPAAKRVSFQEPLTQENFPPLGEKSPKAKSVGGIWAAKVATPAEPKTLGKSIEEEKERIDKLEKELKASKEKLQELTQEAAEAYAAAAEVAN